MSEAKIRNSLLSDKIHRIKEEKEIKEKLEREMIQKEEEKLRKKMMNMYKSAKNFTDQLKE